MVEFANDIGIELISEGVETEAEARCIAGLGCHLAQGYYFGRPAERRPPSVRPVE
jgi:EAL domain-containing protein (putative c-di-GMP-specific phosphodiesterase class I)